MGIKFLPIEPPLPWHSNVLTEPIFEELCELRRLADSTNPSPMDEETRQKHEALEATYRQLRNSVTFGRSEYCAPGTIVRVKICRPSGDVFENHLIGNINTSAGVCDCCSPFEDAPAWVVAYARLDIPTTLGPAKS